VWVSSFKETTILDSFNASGISPLERNAILKTFSNTSLDEQESRESSTSVLSASDWRKMRRLVKENAKDKSNKEVQTLSQSIHSLSVRIDLLAHENKGLERLYFTARSI
jgi:hypothetical protein